MIVSAESDILALGSACVEASEIEARDEGVRSSESEVADAVIGGFGVRDIDGDPAGCG